MDGLIVVAALVSYMVQLVNKETLSRKQNQNTLRGFVISYTQLWH